MEKSKKCLIPFKLGTPANDRLKKKANGTQLRLAPEVKYVWLRFMPYNGLYLVRMLPVARFVAMMARGEMVQVPLLVTTMTRHGHVAANLTGAIYLKPELATAYPQASAAAASSSSSSAHRLEVMTSWVDSRGAAVPECPRSKIRDLCSQLLAQRGIRVLAGFEIEVVLTPATTTTTDSSSSRLDHHQQQHQQHGWSTMTAADAAMLDAIEAIAQALGDAGPGVVDLHQFHAEAAPGQWEFVLGPQPPLQAVDGLVAAREIIAATAAKYGLAATFHPRPHPDQHGTGAHVHLSANGPAEGDGEVEDEETAAAFFGGILAHLPAISAFALPLDASYERVKAGMHSCGEWVCWGTQNRETPLRRITRARFEVRSVCGTANPYLVMAAMLAAGLDGLERGMELPAECPVEGAAQLSQAQREKAGITTRIPQSVEESIDALARDTALYDRLGPQIVKPYAALTTGWNAHLRGMEPGERHALLLSRY
ncbi:FluG family protein [Lasiodiplodia theobromae]|uniref:FluG family protein n=1 Tax=Lasiodiplodia theobromae TaxID=45133 RepID=UPI0015C30365|nr:FluG family protein [Lasiodiplodia theobromae]KAF4534921.1 FluG family protein [Lasiodiplodia theobromae]